MSTAEAAATVPLRRVEYEKLVELGLLEAQDVELLAGRKVTMSPESALHAAVIDAIVEQLDAAARIAGMRVRVGHPVALSDVDEPEPDIALVADRADGYRYGHPTPAQVHLLIEVAHRSLEKDLGEKASRYASAEIVEYWVVDLAAHRTIVHRDPDAAGSYRLTEVVAFGESLETRALPGLRITVT